MHTRQHLASWGGIAALVLAASGPLHAQPAAPALPDGAGRALLTAACTQCHGLGTIVQMRDGQGGWKHQIEIMVLRGAQLTGSEVDTLAQYLSVNFGPGSQRPQGAPVALPDGPGKELLEAHCALCHDLTRVAAIKRSKAAWEAIVANMLGRGAQATPEDARAISGYLVAKFGSN
jgi:cytochrome c5